MRDKRLPSLTTCSEINFIEFQWRRRTNECEKTLRTEKNIMFIIEWEKLNKTLFLTKREPFHPSTNERTHTWKRTQQKQKYDKVLAKVLFIWNWRLKSRGCLSSEHSSLSIYSASHGIELNGDGWITDGNGTMTHVAESEVVMTIYHAFGYDANVAAVLSSIWWQQCLGGRNTMCCLLKKHYMHSGGQRKMVSKNEQTTREKRREKLTESFFSGIEWMFC